MWDDDEYGPNLEDEVNEEWEQQLAEFGVLVWLFLFTKGLNDFIL